MEEREILLPGSFLHFSLFPFLHPPSPHPPIFTNDTITVFRLRFFQSVARSSLLFAIAICCLGGWYGC